MSREVSHSFYRAASDGLTVLHLVCEFAPPNKQLQADGDTASHARRKRVISLCAPRFTRQRTAAELRR
jgi:hypothetical protein